MAKNNRNLFSAVQEARSLKLKYQDFPVAPNAGDPGLIPGQGTRPHRPQLRPGTAK